MSRKQDRLTFVEYAGDFRDASTRLLESGQETYRGQAYTVRYVEDLASRYNGVAAVAGFTDSRFDTILPSGVRAIGGGFRDQRDGKRFVDLVEQTQPDRLILRSPNRDIMRWAIRRRCPTLLLLADSMNDASPRNRIGKILLRRLLKNPIFEIVANHGRSATAQIVKMGVDPAKVIAWDYPPFARPSDRPAKATPGDTLKLVYVGLLIPEKGVYDLLHAVEALVARGRTLHLDIYGRGQTEALDAAIRMLKLNSLVTLGGSIPNDRVIDTMADADIVVVPSQHRYAEGMPLTIYEALCARTPLIVSDHPMFANSIVDQQGALFFEAGNVPALANRIVQLADDHALYGRLSTSGSVAWEGLQISAKWHEIIDHWLDGGSEARAWLRDHSEAQGDRSRR